VRKSSGGIKDMNMKTVKSFSKVLLLCAVAFLCFESPVSAKGFSGPTISFETQSTRRSSGGASSVAITPGSADLGRVSNHQLRKGLAWEVWGVDSKIQGHSIAIQDIYHDEGNSDDGIIAEINPLVNLPKSLPLYEGFRDLAYIKFKTDADLPLGKHEVRVACDVTLPESLGGSEISPYVVYRFEVVEGPLTVWGNVIGRVENDRFLAKLNDASAMCHLKLHK
jgi:hypothetical protein